MHTDEQRHKDTYERGGGGWWGGWVRPEEEEEVARWGDRTGGRQRGEGMRRPGRRRRGERGGHKGKEGVSIVLAQRSPQAQYTSTAARCHCK